MRVDFIVEWESLEGRPGVFSGILWSCEWLGGVAGSGKSFSGKFSPRFASSSQAHSARAARRLFRARRRAAAHIQGRRRAGSVDADLATAGHRHAAAAGVKIHATGGEHIELVGTGGILNA